MRPTLVPLLCVSLLSPVHADVEEIVVTGNRMIVEGAYAVEKIDADRLAWSGQSGLARALELSPGLDVAQTSSGGRTEVYLRGGDANFTAVFLDGVRLNDITDSRGGAVDFSVLSPGEVNAITILRGPSSVLSGSAALAGTISLTTPSPEAEGPPVRLTGLIGESGLRMADALANLRLSSRWALGVGAFTMDSGAQPDGGDAQTIGARAKLLFTDEQVGTLEISLRHAETERRALPLTSGGPEFAASLTFEERESELTTASLRAERTIGAWAVNTRVGYLRRGEHVTTPFIPDGLLSGAPASAADTLFQALTLAMVADRTDIAGVDITLGADFDHHDGRSRATIDLGVPVNRDFDTTRTSGALFAEFRKSFSERVLGHAGVRSDLFEDGSLAPTFRGGLLYTNENSGSRLSINAGNGFKRPSLFALGDPLIGDDALEDETSFSVEAGFAQDVFSGVASVSVTAFHVRYENLIDFDFETFALVNRAKVSIDGLEFALEASPAPSLRLRAFAALNEADAQDGALLGRPRWRAGAYGDWSLTSRLTLYAAYRFRGATQSASAPTGFVELDPSHRLDISARVAIGGSADLIATLEDAADSEGPRQVGFPAQGRRFMVSASIAF